MCGIVGYWNMDLAPAAGKKVLENMVRRIRHRGPDGQGLAQGHSWGVGHARLAIVDLTGGAQPIWNEDRTQLVVGNNEIYNAPELRKELETLGHRFTTHSDTEVALHAWEEWGETAFDRLNGMFALAIVDIQNQRCILARDPMGIKPLHFTSVGNGFAFSSEVKAFFGVPGFKSKADRDAMHLFMNLRYIPDERTLFSGVARVEPGSVVILEGENARKSSYFDFSRLRASTKISFQDATEQLEQILERSVHRHLIADVEVASYLSGGVDSSLVTGIASKFNPGLRTFCVGFGEPTDENQDAAKVAHLFRTRHEDLYVGMSPLSRLKEAIWHVEEPKVNCIQGFLLAEQVSKRVKVALSGLGGDELFAGYTNHDILYPMSLMAKHLNLPSLAPSLSAFQSSRMPKWMDHFFRAGDLALSTGDPLAFYCILRNSFDHNAGLMNQLYEGKSPDHWNGLTQRTLERYFDRSNPDLMNELLILEARTKLVNDFLLTEDRVSMANALEVRVPFLDRELVDFAFSLPSPFKYRFRQKKRILKQAAQKWLTPDILEKEKWGFSFNPYLLFNKELRAVAQRILTEKKVKEMGFFSWKWIEEILNAPPSPKLRWHYFNLWVMVGYMMWHEQFIEGVPGARDGF